MKILDKSFDFSYILGLVGGRTTLNDPFGIQKKMKELEDEGYDFVVFKANGYGFPRFVYALKFGDPYFGSSDAKDDDLAGFKLAAVSDKAAQYIKEQTASSN